MPARTTKRSGDVAVATPSRSSKLPWPATASPDEKQKNKKPRLAAGNRSPEVAKPPPEEPQQEEVDEPHEEAEVEERPDENEELLSLDQRVEAACSAWTAEPGSKVDDLGSASFDVALAAKTWATGRLPFRLLAAALEEAGNGVRCLRAWTNLVRLVLRCSTDKENDISALCTILLDRKVYQRLLQRHLIDAFSASFGLKDMATVSIRSMTTSELADAALAARQKQRTLFQPKGLAAAEVAAVIKEHAALRVHAKAGPGLPDALRKLFGRSAAEGRETWHLVRALQGLCGQSGGALLHALGHALSLSSGMGHLKKDAFGKELVEAEDAVKRAYAEVSGQTGRLVAGLLGGEGLRGVASSCSAQCGARILPQRAQVRHSIADSLEALGQGAVLAEYQLEGDRVQLHARRAGAEVQVFDSDHGEWPERNDEVLAALAGHLEGVADCVLEAILIKPRVKKPKVEAAAGEDAKGSATGEAANDKPATAEELGSSATVVAIFDMLVLNGRSMTRMPLRHRRVALQKVLREGPAVKMVRTVELAAGTATVERVKTELGHALSAFSLAATAEDKAFTRSTGLLLKLLDGPQAEYFAGARRHNWQAVTKPHATGAEADAKLLACLNERETAQLVDGDEFHFCVVSARRTNTPEGVKDVLNVESQFKAMGVQPTWYVDEASLEGYRGLGLRAIVGGKLIPARNLALEDAESIEKICVQVSDDIARWEYYVGDPKQKTLQEANGAAKRAERLQVSPVAAARFILAKMRGVPADEPRPRLGGVYPLGNMGHSFHTEEFSSRNFILGDFFVADNSKCRFDSTMSLKEDYDFTCSHLMAHGAVLRCNRMVIQAKHETNAGGACTVRDSAGERERENIRILQRKWPGAFHPHPTRPNQIVLRWESLKLAEQVQSKSKKAEKGA